MTLNGRFTGAGSFRTHAGAARVAKISRFPRRRSTIWLPNGDALWFPKLYTDPDHRNEVVKGGTEIEESDPGTHAFNRSNLVRVIIKGRTPRIYVFGQYKKRGRYYYLGVFTKILERPNVGSIPKERAVLRRALPMVAVPHPSPTPPGKPSTAAGINSGRKKGEVGNEKDA